MTNIFILDILQNAYIINSVSCTLFYGFMFVFLLRLELFLRFFFFKLCSVSWKIVLKIM